MAHSSSLAKDAPRSRQAKRKFIRYAELSSSEDEARHPKQLRRSTRQRPDYCELSSDDTSTDSEDSSPSHHLNAPASHATKSRPILPRTSPKRHIPSKRSSSSATEMKSKSSKHKKVSATIVQDAASAQKAPAVTPVQWQILPYEILVQIFHIASDPLFDKLSRRPTASIEWLVDISRSCKSFHEAAISTLLFSPPLLPSHRAHGLLARLKQNDELALNYKTKIRRIDIEVKQLIKKRGFSLVELVQYTPQLRDLIIYSALDYTSMFAQPSSARAKWSYPSELFDILDESIRLRSFEFNGRFPDTKNVVATMSAVSRRPAFRNLRSLSLLNLENIETASDEGEHLNQSLVIRALSSLNNLRELTMKNCSILNGNMLPNFPQGLSHLSLISCDSIRSPDLQMYLESRGETLSFLCLNGCQSLDFGFSFSLAQTCPRLTVLRMDCSYADPSAYHDVEPHFTEFLRSDYPPTWPNRIQVIELLQLRRLSVETAETLLNSLISVGPSLSLLRVLSLKMILKVGWRERSALRRKYTARLEEMFSRQASRLRHSLPSPETSRPSSSHFDSSEGSSASTRPSRLRRKSARVARKRKHNALSYDSSTDAQSHAGQASEEGKLPTFSHDVQGMCSVVRLQIDDQRPSDFQYKEEHFLHKGDEDEEADDGEWTGRDRIEETRHYAW